jgi:DNA-binding NtrC family response regulator
MIGMTMHGLKQRLKPAQSFAGIIGQGVAMQNLFAAIRDAADLNVPVLIQGERGTGKEQVAEAIHNEGPRANKPFVPVNCGALPEGLLETELFGYMKGAFKGAKKDRKGRFELAEGGTLFLEEVADLPRAMQEKLLRVIQEGTFERVGGEKTIRMNARIIGAADRNLRREVEKGNFRQDLFNHINGIPIHLPALRKRKNDIPLLIENFIIMASDEGKKTNGISEEVITLMMDYPWPGNVRELQNAIRHALLKCNVIQPRHLPLELQKWEAVSSSRVSSRKLDTESFRVTPVRNDENQVKAAGSMAHL